MPEREGEFTGRYCESCGTEIIFLPNAGETEVCFWVPGIKADLCHFCQWEISHEGLQPHHEVRFEWCVFTKYARMEAQGGNSRAFLWPAG